MAKGIPKVATRSYLADMRKVGIKLLKNKLSEYLRMVVAGEVILVTDRDQVVAELRAPTSATRAALQDEKLAELIRRGLITPATRPPGPIPPLPPGMPRMTLEEILADLDESRADRWPPT
jgi:antitoxin (DNA-binding transcriptional repressor) of toxin-antitoxin stability system